MAKNFMEQFDAALRVSAPIVAVRSVDQAEVVAKVAETYAEMNVLRWDTVNGIVGVNDLGKKVVRELALKPQDTMQFDGAMVAADKLPKGSILFALNGHRQLVSQEPMASAVNVQAVANLRDRFKVNMRMLVLLGRSMSIPSEIEQDIVLLEHPFPTADELAKMVRELFQAAKLDTPTRETVARTVEAVRGLSMFAAEQAVAMSLTQDGVDHGALLERQRVAIEQTKGLKVWRGTERFSDIVGQDNLKSHLRLRGKAKTPIGVVVFLDEIDKSLANVEGDQSGVKMDQLRTLLTDMENHGWNGFVAVGAPGGGKSLIAKAFGNEVGAVTVEMDLGGAESKFVGESQENIRAMMDIIKSIGGGHAYFIATSNAASVMRPELQRRFTDGMWMFDIMSSAERAAAWKLYRAKYEIPANDLQLGDEGWTGAEIRNCCRYAWDTGATLAEAARFIVPMSQARADDLEALRKYAHGRLLDANKPGVYHYTGEAMAQQVRSITLPGNARVQ